MHNSLIREAFPLFNNELITALEEVGEETVFAADQVIVKQGKPFWKTYIVLKGCIKVHRENDEGSEFIISYLSRGIVLLSRFRKMFTCTSNKLLSN